MLREEYEVHPLDDLLIHSNPILPIPMVLDTRANPPAAESDEVMFARFVAGA
jgi:hypothetical protein